MSERHAIGDLGILIAVAAIALFFGASKLLIIWTPARSMARALGNLMVSVCSAVLVGLVLHDPLSDQPELLVACAGAAAWIGGDVMDRLAKVLLKNIGNGNGGGA